MSGPLFVLGLCLGAWMTAAAVVIYAGLVGGARYDEREQAAREQAQ